MRFPYGEVEKKLGYVFKDKTLLEIAFTHSSYANAHGGLDNERMEFLGDSVLQLIITEWLYQKDPTAQEGLMTKTRQKYVCEEALDEAVGCLDIAQYLQIEGGKENVGKKTVSSIFEAVLAAIYLDGGYDAAKRFVLERACLKETESKKNPKSALQEYLQKRGKKPPVYESQKEGKDNDPVFYCVAVADGEQGKGKGKNKKQAEETAATELLKKLEQKEGSSKNVRKK